MRSAALLLFAASAVALAAQNAAPAAKVAPVNTPPAAKVGRAAVENVERSADRKFLAVMKEDDPFAILGNTRGVYIDGYGLVFSAEIDLAPTAAPNPFKPAYGRGETQLLREKKKYRITLIKDSMRELIAAAAAAFDSLRTDENIAFAVTIPYYRWELSDGMPRQIVVSASRKVALDAKAGSPVAAAAFRIQEFF